MLSLQEVPGAVDDVLTAFFAGTAPTLNAIYPTVGDAGDVVQDFVLGGGKRIRPLFVHTGWRCGVTESPAPSAPGATEDETLRVCAAIELIQACALIHDDILDRSDTRRGRPTVHRVFEARHGEAGWSGDAAHHGTSVAILAGDLALAWADDLVHGYTPAPEAGPDPRPLSPRVGRLWSRMRTEVLGGQLLDITNEVSGDESITAAYRVMEYKTAAYTVARPLELGAALAGASPGLGAALRVIGTDLGLAFQLRDDVLGAFGDPAETGKPSGDDLVAGKRTVLIAQALEATDTAQADVLRSLLGHALSADELAAARGIVTGSGALAAVETQIDTLLRSALDGIAALPVDAAARDDLTALAHRISHRQT
ncbi:MAG: polyprenyl synthetase family protein [Gordonia sp. (in: high G+C Gram-positive bacteria)]|uniref:polyprenyl synthetase family protein n=1 Tax=Gordonia sp. (in: high G+C Gram-positive bacteria) TaxID=84139 RepID=UPI0039E4A1E2